VRTGAPIVHLVAHHFLRRRPSSAANEAGSVDGALQRRVDGWHLELAAFGAAGARADERVATVPGLKELRLPLARDGWERRELSLSFDGKGSHERLPILVTVLAYGAAKDRADFVPDLTSADAVLLLESGDAALDAQVASAADEALAKRLGSPPRIVEHAKGDSADVLKTALRDAVKRAVKALKSGELNEFWKQSVRTASDAHDAAVFGPLTIEKMTSQPSGELVAFMLRVVQGRARRAVASGRVPNAEAYGRCLSARWQRLLAVHVLETLVADAGVAALFGAPDHRAMEREEVTFALAGLKRMGAPKKAAIVERALAVAREAKLWEGAADELATKVLEELSAHFYAVDDEPLRVRLEEDIRKAPEDFTLGAYED
jgi:hypothetical protein